MDTRSQIKSCGCWASENTIEFNKKTKSGFVNKYKKEGDNYYITVYRNNEPFTVIVDNFGFKFLKKENRTLSIDSRGYPCIAIPLKNKKRQSMFLNNLFIYGIDYYIKNLDILVDHKNGNKLDNRLINLRPANEFQNNQNAKIRKDNSCRIKGFTVQIPSNRPTAHILVRIQAYKTRLKKYFIFNINGLKKAIIWDYNTRQKLHNDFTNYGFDIKNKTIEEIINEQSQIFINNLTEYQLKIFNNNGIVYQRKKGTFNVQ